MSRGKRLLTSVAGTVVVATLAVVPGSPAAADPAAQPEPVAALRGAPGAGPGASGRTVTLDGHGFGHGKGLSQYGAQRAATRGKSHTWILRYYYPHTGFRRKGGRIRVLISGDTHNDLVVRDRQGLKLHGLGAHRTWRLRVRRAHAWRITPLRGGARSKIAWRGGGRWHTWRRIHGDAEFVAGGKPIRLLGPAGPTPYRGRLRSASDGTGRVTVNVLSLEQYLRGVVPQEVPALWEPAAVRAQAVAARTYAAFERMNTARGAAYDLCDTAHCQVYGGKAAEHPASNRAVRQTRRQVVAKHGKPIFAQFNASSGGWTVDGGRPYLVAKRDRFDAWSGNPYHDWKTTLTAHEIEQQWPGIGTLQDVSVTEQDGHGDWGGRALQVTLTGADGQTTVTGDTFRIRFGLYSTWFRVTTDL